MTLSDDPPPRPGPWHQRTLTFFWYDVVLLVWSGLEAFFKEVTTSPPSLKVEEMKTRDGHVAVITGGPRGLALGLIKRLAQLDHTIIMGVRNVRDAERRMEEFAKLNSDLKFNTKFFRMDLKSLSSVREFADNVLANTTRVDLLLCNAAIMREPYVLTEDGYESQFQVNHLANFLLTYLLLDKLKETAKIKGSPTHVIYTSSILQSYGKLYWDEIEKSVIYSTNKFYFASKLYDVVMIQALEKKMMEEGAQVHFNCVHPGLVPTDLWYEGISTLAGRFGNFFSRFFRTKENAADTILWPAFAPEYQDRGGLYFESGRPIPLSSEARNEINQTKLYVRSMNLIKRHLK